METVAKIRFPFNDIYQVMDFLKSYKLFGTIDVMNSKEVVLTIKSFRSDYRQSLYYVFKYRTLKGYAWVC